MMVIYVLENYRKLIKKIHLIFAELLYFKELVTRYIYITRVDHINKSQINYPTNIIQ